MNAPVPNIFADAVDARSLPDWLSQRRADAVATLRTQGVPHRRIEEWKYSDLKTALEPANDSIAATAAWSIENVPTGVTLFDLADLSAAPEWVRAHFGKAAAAETVPAASLALAEGGFALHVARNAVVTEAVRVGLSANGHVRALVVLEDGAGLTLIEQQSAAGAFRNTGVEIVVGANARLTHVRLAQAAPNNVQIEDVAVRVARGGLYRAHLFTGGAELSRLTLRMTLKELGANAELSGVSVLGGSLHADVTTHVYHAAGETQSTQLFKHVAGGKSRAVYQGKITVAKGADKSDSRQTAKALLLGERAEADLKPELEIFADDVKCAHGAAVGDLDADSLFYLRARGIPEQEARNMLLRAFLREAVDDVADEAIRATLWQSVEDALPRAMVSAL
ncbi:MAG TPA: Fe-S cluster assembly protein SufD [Rhizomicrobium sp.]|jgi:Fe-S cluster assembly protein SufD|nr:Fe-S cluster assembly protein SufD [Rhizomicrobium sp.]